MPRLDRDQKELLEQKKQAFESMNEEALYKELTNARKSQRGYEFKKKADPEIQQLAREIKQFIAENTPDEIRKMDLEVKQAKKDVKGLIKDKIEDKKIKASEHNRDINFSKAEQEAILNILNDRGK